MSTRKRDDRVKPGAGIDGDLGRSFSRRNRTSPWGSEDEVGPIDSASQMPAADENKDIQFMWSTRDIMDDVEANQRPGGEFDSTGAIKAGVNRKQ